MKYAEDEKEKTRGICQRRWPGVASRTYLHWHLFDLSSDKFSSMQQGGIIPSPCVQQRPSPNSTYEKSRLCVPLFFRLARAPNLAGLGLAISTSPCSSLINAMLLPKLGFDLPAAAGGRDDSMFARIWSMASTSRSRVCSMSDSSVGRMASVREVEFSVVESLECSTSGWIYIMMRVAVDEMKLGVSFEP